MNTFPLFYLFTTWNPYVRIAIALIIIAVAGGFCGFVIKNGLDDISKKETTIKHLEAFSLDQLRKFAEAYHGISFNLVVYSSTDPEAVRHLINLDLIELNAFPSDKNSQIYSFTNLGRYVLEKKLKRKLLSEDFCEMMKVWYWQGYPEELRKETHLFELKYKIPWAKAWEAFKPIMINKKEPQQTEEAFAIFLKYIEGKSYDEINTNLVRPWQRETEKLKKKTWYRYIL